MTLALALLCAFGCAICYGSTVVLQKDSADEEAKALSLHVGLLVRLLHRRRYLFSVVLDGAAWILTLIAVHNLPLLVVQPIIAFSVVVTALIEAFFLHKRLGREVFLAMAFIVAGLSLLAISAKPETSAPLGGVAKLVIVLLPAALALIGATYVKLENGTATTVLAAVAGLAFGATAIVGRILDFNQPLLHLVISPVFISLVADSIIGTLTLAIALQRHHASVVNAVMMTFETVAPITFGIIFLADRPRHGYWVMAAIGAGVAVAGSLLIAARTPE